MSPAIIATERMYGLVSATLRPHFQQQLDALLQDGEEILWQGQPTPPKGNAFTGNSLGCLVWVLVAAAPAIVLIISEEVAHAKPTYDAPMISMYKLDLILFSLMALIAIWFKSSVRTFVAEYVYAVTNSRILIIRTGKNHPQKIASILPDQLAPRAYQWDAVSFGTMYFPNAVECHWLPNGRAAEPSTGCYFYDLKEIKQIDRLISETFQVEAAVFMPRLNRSTGEYQQLDSLQGSVAVLQQSVSKRSG